MISIIITCYNLENLISESIQSVINQTNDNYELIVVDDTSTDNSLSIINSYSQYIDKLIINSGNKGIGYSKKIGGESASGDHILFLDGDDTINPNTVELLDGISSDLIMSPVKFFGNVNKINKNESLYDSDCTTFNSYCISKDCFLRSDFSTLRFFEDIDSAVRIKYNAKSITVLKECFYNHRSHGNSSCSTSGEFKKNKYYCLACIHNLEYFKDKDITFPLLSFYILKQKYRILENLGIEDEETRYIKSYINIHRYDRV